MAVSRSLRVWHRRLALVVGLQLFAWTVSGFLFTWRPIEEVHGDHWLAEPPAAPALTAEFAAGLVPLARITAARGAVGTAVGAQLAWYRDRWTWRFDGDPGLYDAATGAPLGEMDEDEARTRAAAFLRAPGEVTAASFLAESPGRGEFRGGVAPAWRVDFDAPDAVHVYVDARTGALLKLRTAVWRRFDFFWGFHIMDWNGREDFHHLLLRVVAALGVLSATTGVGLTVAIYAARWRKKRKSAAASDGSR
ncbi:MAG TPA: PepSY domain-containing protein [Planctomycetota bacterium]